MCEILIAAAPLILLLGSLLLGHYPGCEAIVRISERIAAPASPAGPRSSPLRRRRFWSSAAASGGLLLALRPFGPGAPRHLPAS